MNECFRMAGVREKREIDKVENKEVYLLLIVVKQVVGLWSRIHRSV